MLDLDDTIIDYGSSAESAWRAVCDAAGDEVEGLDGAALCTAIGTVRRWYWSDPERHREGRADLRAASRGIVQQALTTLGHDLPRLAQTMADTYRDFRAAAITLFPGAVETLERLRQRHIRLGAPGPTSVRRSNASTWRATSTTS